MKRGRFPVSDADRDAAWGAAQDLGERIAAQLDEVSLLTFEFVLAYLTMRWVEAHDDQPDALVHLRGLTQIFIEGANKLGRNRRRRPEKAPF